MSSVTERPDRHGGLRADHLWPVVSTLTVLTYNTWALWQVNGHEAIFDGYLSEFSASDQPHNLFFRGGDLVTSLILLAVGLRALALLRGGPGASRAVVGAPPPGEARSRWEVVAWLGLVLFAVSTFFDSFFAMDCSPTLSAACKVAEETGQLSLVHYAHSYTSVGAQTGIVSSMVAGYLALVRTAGRPGRGPGLRRWVLVLNVAEVVSLVVMMAMLAAGVPGIGVPQAVMVAVASFWFALVGFGLVRRADRSDGDAQPVLADAERSAAR